MRRAKPRSDEFPSERSRALRSDPSGYLIRGCVIPTTPPSPSVRWQMHRRRAAAIRHNQGGGNTRRRRTKTVANVPGKVPDAIEQVVRKRPQKCEQDDFADDGSGSPAASVRRYVLVSHTVQHAHHDARERRRGEQTCDHADRRLARACDMTSRSTAAGGASAGGSHLTRALCDRVGDHAIQSDRRQHECESGKYDQQRHVEARACQLVRESERR